MNKHIKIDYNGWLNLYKPVGISSNQALNLVKKSLNVKKLGHAGTLDPFAEGILPIAMGYATRLVSYAQNASKNYRFIIKWGQSTDSHDHTGTITGISDKRPTKEEIIASLHQFIGVIDQAPPQFSAIKVKGQRAYTKARAGENFDLPSRKITIHDLRLISHHHDETEFFCHCEKGTYIRSITRDLAAIHGAEGHCASLIREKVGMFTKDNAISLEELEKIGHKPNQADQDADFILPLDAVLDGIPAFIISENEAIHLKHGNPLFFYNKADLKRLPLFEEKRQYLIKQDSNIIAIGEFESGAMRIKTRLCP